MDNPTSILDKTTGSIMLDALLIVGAVGVVVLAWYLLSKARKDD